MTTLTIRNLDPAAKERLRVCATPHGHSIEEARRILSESAGAERQPENLADIALRLCGPDGEVDLELPLRQRGRAPPHFD